MDKGKCPRHTGAGETPPGTWASRPHNLDPGVLYRCRPDRTITMNPIDQTLKWLKWPVGMAAVLLLPGAALAVLDLARRVIANPAPLLPFLGGCMLYATLWHLLFRHRPLGTFFSTLEHELTHALFAVATWHRVAGIRATWRSGGQIEIHGGSNWLIAAAPYFFPTVCVVLAPLLAIFSSDDALWASGLMGFAFAYHAISTYHETHLGQSDLQRVGFVFSALFLPTANLVSMGAIVAFSHGGFVSLQQFARSILPHSWALLERLTG